MDDTKIQDLINEFNDISLECDQLWTDLEVALEEQFDHQLYSPFFDGEDVCGKLWDKMWSQLWLELGDRIKQDLEND